MHWNASFELNPVIRLVINSNDMKKYIFFLSLFISVVSVSCSLSLDIDGADSEGRLVMEVQGSNSDGSVSEGGYLDLKVSASDADGIQSLRIEIPALGIDFFTSMNPNKVDQEINQTFYAEVIDWNQPNVIWVTLTDDNQNSYSKTIRFNSK